MNELRITRKVSRAPIVVMQAIRAAATDARESAIPLPLRTDGVRRVRVSIEDARFELYFDGGERRMGTVRLRGEVLAAPAGAIIKAKVTRRNTATFGAGVLAALGLITVATGQSAGWFFILLSAPAAAIAYFQLGTIPEWMEPRARYLLSRLYDALDRITPLANASSPGPANER